MLAVYADWAVEKNLSLWRQHRLLPAKLPTLNLQPSYCICYSILYIVYHYIIFLCMCIWMLHYFLTITADYRKYTSEQTNVMRARAHNRALGNVRWKSPAYSRSHWLASAVVAVSWSDGWMLCVCFVSRCAWVHVVAAAFELQEGTHMFPEEYVCFV